MGYSIFHALCILAWTTFLPTILRYSLPLTLSPPLLLTVISFNVTIVTFDARPRTCRRQAFILGGEGEEKICRLVWWEEWAQWWVVPVPLPTHPTPATAWWMWSTVMVSPNGEHASALHLQPAPCPAWPSRCHHSGSTRLLLRHTPIRRTQNIHTARNLIFTCLRNRALAIRCGALHARRVCRCHARLALRMAYEDATCVALSFNATYGAARRMAAGGMNVTHERQARAAPASSFSSRLFYAPAILARACCSPTACLAAWLRHYFAPAAAPRRRHRAGICAAFLLNDNACSCLRQYRVDITAPVFAARARTGANLPPLPPCRASVCVLLHRAISQQH